MVKLYRNIILALAFMQLLWIFFPWATTAYSGKSRAALIWSGTDAFISSQSEFVLSIVFTIMYFILYLGLFFFRRWARIFFTVLVIVGGLVIPAYGLTIMSGYEAAIGYFITLGEGFVLGMAYFSNQINLKFNK